MTQPEISAGLVKQLRDLTGAGMMDCKRALTEAGGDLDKAQELLRLKGLAGAKKRGGRVAKEGLVHAYVHGEGSLGVLVEVNTETDFVARTDEFRNLAKELAMQIAASDPRWISREDVPEDVLESERKIYAEKARSDGKPDHVIEKVVDGQIQFFFKDTVLLDQPYIREPKRAVGDLVSEVAAKVGENVVIRRFARFKLGEEL
jgi:elongation factor Ts